MREGEKQQTQETERTEHNCGILSTKRKKEEYNRSMNDKKSRPIIAQHARLVDKAEARHRVVDTRKREWR